ncbi:MAG TPA: hypothetical protein VEO95_11035, partial [Chthoniobacteraceae bacterium]|nr:hypothetical protein [Chthoniobacteraceae bacterium]
MTGVRAKLTSVGRKLGLVRPHALDPRTQAFIDFNRAKWSGRPADERNGVVLVGLFAWNPSIFCYGYVTNQLAEPHGAAVRGFCFQERMSAGTKSLYASFGAELGLSHEQAAAHRALAARQADEIFASLQKKSDVLSIAVEGVPLGDLIYDTYLRYVPRATVDVRDPELRATILDTLLIYYACRDYLATHKVLAVIPDHTVYSQCGVLIRLASRAGIPIYFVYYNPGFVLIRLDFKFEAGKSVIPTRWPYSRFREFFATLTPARQERARARAREALSARLSGRVDHKILAHVSAYQPATGERLMPDTGRPRVLVLPNDFCDGVHGYRRMLFDDCFEWTSHLLERASETPFDWFVKPHPNVRLRAREAMNETNHRAFEQLKARFPKITFLDASASNRQLVDEGIRAMFTMHGTAGHEFAYMGVPVVNAGDNPHIAYPFNIHAQSIAQYDELIRRADSLDVPIDKA